MKYAGGDEYVGQWQNGMYEGKGTLYDREG